MASLGTSGASPFNMYKSPAATALGSTPASQSAVGGYPQTTTAPPPTTPPTTPPPPGGTLEDFKAYYKIPESYTYDYGLKTWVGQERLPGATPLTDYGTYYQGSPGGSVSRAVSLDRKYNGGGGYYFLDAPRYNDKWTNPGTGTDPGTGTGTDPGTGGTTQPPPTIYTPPIQQQPIAVASPGTAAVPNALIAYAAPTDIPAGWGTAAPAQGGLGQASNFAQVKW